MYGAGNNYIDNTYLFSYYFIKDCHIFIPKNTTFNELFGDPIPNTIKNIIIKTHNEHIIINEYLETDFNYTISS